MGDAKLGTPPVGGAFDFVTRYASLNSNVKAMRSDYEPAFIFGEKTVQIFKNASQVRQEKGNSILTSGLRLVFCDNAEHLLKYYFKNFHFEGVEKPWKAFTTFWPPEMIARHFGIEPNYISEHYSFVVLSIARYHDSRKLTSSSGNLEFNAIAVSAAKQVIVGKNKSLDKFCRKTGTHYINSFVTGDLMYQVFVYKRKFFKYFEKKFKDPALSALMTSESLNTYLSPKYAMHVGRIGTASGIESIATWANENLIVEGTSKYKSLFKIALSDQVLRDLFEHLEENALLELELKSLAPIFQDPESRDFFNEVVGNDLKMYEIEET